MAEEPHGYIYTLQDVKTLILYVLAQLDQPVSTTTLYELCFQDDRLSYIDLALALPELSESGHISDYGDRYAITELGRTDGKVLESDLPRSLRQRCDEAAAAYRSELKRAETALCELRQREDGLYDVVMTQQSAMGQLMKIELMAPNLNQARVVERAWRDHSDAVLKAVMTALTGK